MHAFFASMKVPFISRTRCQAMQDKGIYPIIQEAWFAEKARLLSLVDSRPVILIGDGRCDSPGHSARYGCYSFMLSETNDPQLEGKIIEIQMVDLAEQNVKNSQALEPVGLQRGLDQLIHEDNVNIRIVATDRHITVGSIMKKEYSFIDHQFDVWHMAKNLQKKLTAAGKLRGGEPLQQWRQSITNHLWWCCKTCGGDAELLKEMWLSLLQHCQNRHTWITCSKFNQCSHPKLSRNKVKDILWLDPKSVAFERLQGIVADKMFLKALPQLTQFCHTGSLEIFHSVLLKYAPKRQHFPHKGMKARYYLGALDWNKMEHFTVLPESQSDVSVVFSKRRGEYVVRTKRRGDRKEATSEIGIQLLERVLDAYITKRNVPPMIVPGDLHDRMSKKDKPETGVIFESFRSRMSKN